jgi:hypothetical protein
MKHRTIGILLYSNLLTRSLADFVELAQQRDRIVVKPKRLIDAEDALTPDEERLVLKGEAQIRRGEHVTLERLEHELERRTRKRSREASLEASC